jgi:hypothetical protein
VGEPARVQRSTLEIAATWLACGLDPEQVTFYRQSDIPEIPELTWLLTCVTGKGLLNRAHAYKASVDKNTAAGAEPDAGVTAGLFMYPVLMAADILMFNAHQVPVGRDQVQHIEMARDMASSFNHLYGEHFTLPEAAIEEHVATLPGLDGRKMSKSYDNTIPLFAPARAAAQAHHGHRHRLARARRAQGHRRLGPVPALPGLCQPEETAAWPRPMPTASPGATPSNCCSSAWTGNRPHAHGVRRADAQNPARIERTCARRRKGPRGGHARSPPACAMPWACAHWTA